MSFSTTWEKQKLKDLCVKIGSGATPAGGKENYKSSGISLIRSQNIYNHRFTYDGLAYIDENQANKLDNVIVQEEDVLLNITGDSVCRCCIVDKSVLPARVNQHVAIIRTDKRRLLPLFAKSFLTTESMQAFMLSLAQTGGTRAALTKGMIENFEIPVPDLKEQELICRILAPLDKKIGINESINNRLKEMAQALFKRWFVDFEFPSENGEPYKSSGGEFEESELGLIPKGWKVKVLSEVTQVIDCLHSKKPKDLGTGKTLLQVWNIADNGCLDTTKKYLISEEDYKLWTSRIEVKEGDCVITNVGRVGAVAQIPTGKKYAIGRNMTAIRPQVIPPTFLIEYLLSDTMNIEISKKVDSGTILDSLNVKGIMKLRMVIPPDDVLNKFESLTRPLRASVEVNIEENKNLIVTRNALLPKLISGEIRVPLKQENLYTQIIDLPMAAEGREQYSTT
ncbi:restriction endonuclease subunit S [Cohnella candidum]|uniref:Restriction endonuclease subunit S n=1 Tax=Cohnella candidum TaxID=2674991 RepID=A0A3G3K5N3_9BACL|nr:restriction endonuclease subunit S [Cohnella candidum]AYQ75387.1 restriction endonuclease subunit S [Cohnella candidum]